jgi:hypothetical protein
MTPIGWVVIGFLIFIAFTAFATGRYFNMW